MGKWFPGWRTGTREQWQAYRAACYELFRNTRYQAAAKIRAETPRYLDLNDRVNDLEAPLTRTQASYHWGRALTREDKDFCRMQRTADRQARAQRRAARRTSSGKRR